MSHSSVHPSLNHHHVGDPGTDMLLMQLSLTWMEAVSISRTRRPALKLVSALVYYGEIDRRAPRDSIETWALCAHSYEYVVDSRRVDCAYIQHLQNPNHAPGTCISRSKWHSSDQPLGLIIPCNYICLEARKSWRYSQQLHSRTKQKQRRKYTRVSPFLKGLTQLWKSRRIYPKYMPKCSVGSTNYVCNFLPKNIE